MTRPPKLLLLTGVPGTGKTEAGKTLASGHGFAHLEMEEFIQALPPKTRNDLLQEALRLRNTGKDVVITWGFLPGADDGTIRALQAAGFRMVWFDGDRVAARRAFIRRGTVDEEMFDIQMARIEALDLEPFEPMRLNPFGAAGRFLGRDAIAERLLSLVEA